MAIIIPIGLVMFLRIFYPLSYQWLMAYMLGVALVFKSSIVSFWLISQLNILAFIKGLTLADGMTLILKRWFDGVSTVWIKTYILDNLLEALIEAKNFYLRQELKRKLKNLFFFLFVTLFSSWVLYFVGTLENLFLFAEIKLFIAGVFKAIIAFLTKIFSWSLSLFALGWVGPLIQVFALSYLFHKLEIWLGPHHSICRFLNFIGNQINLFLYYLGILRDKHIDPMLVQPIVTKSKAVGVQLSTHIQNKKIREEYRYFESFENIIMQGHIDAYYSFKGMELCKDKRVLYARINQKTNNNLDIVAYVSRDENGNLLKPSEPNDFRHDVFLLESFASHKKYGVKVYERPLDTPHIAQSDFWVLNTSAFPVILRSNRKNFSDTMILPHGLQLIKPSKPFCYKQGDVFCEFENRRVAVTAIERIDAEEITPQSLKV